MNLKASSLKNFFQVELWKVKLNTLPPVRAWFYRQIRILMIAVSEFGKDKCDEKASALTYFSLLSIVPVVAMAFGIATAFGLESYLKEELAKYFAGQQEVLDYVMQFANRMLDNASGGVISGISLIFLIYAVVRLLSNIEDAFNHIWGTKKSRKFIRKISDYMSIILLGPIILIISSSLTVFVTTQIKTITGQIEFIGFAKPIIFYLLNLIPYTLIWLLMFLIYIIFPNTVVKVKSALVAGILAGTLYQLAQWAWINGQVLLSNYNAVYGSLALLPLLLIWLNVSWIIVLFGAEYSFAMQNVESWKYEHEHLSMNIKTKKKVTLLILNEIIGKFEKEGGPIAFQVIQERVPLPYRFLMDMCQELEEAGLINKVVSESEEEVLFQPALDINQIDVYTVYSRLEERHLNSVSLPKSQKMSEIESTAAKLEQTLKKDPSNVLIKDL